MSLSPLVLPIAQLESLKFKTTQLHESILALQRTIEYGGAGAMPSWPDILSKYNVLLSQSLNLSVGLVGAGTSTSSDIVGGVGVGPGGNQFTRIALHPSGPLTDTALDNDLIPLLRNQQTTEVLRLENETVRRLGERMQTRGIAGVLGVPSSSHLPGTTLDGEREKPTYPQVISDLTDIRNAHDARVDRAIRAVTMLREKYDWKARVEVEVEEPEELEWDPRRRVEDLADAEEEDGVGDEDVEMNGDVNGDVDADADADAETEGGESSDEEEAVDAMVVGDGEGEGEGDVNGLGTPGSGSGSGSGSTPTPNGI
jgi:hypothetical protein